MLKRQEAGRSALLAAVMPSKGDGAGTDTFRPHRAYGQLRDTENRQRLRGSATASLMLHRRLIAVPPCSFRCCLMRTFTTARPLAACFSSPRVETAIIRLPALSAYNRLALPGLVSSIFTGIDEELNKDDRRRQFHFAQLYEIPLLCRISKPMDYVRSHRPLSLLVVLQIL